jgi:molybdenum-dependent DNA-binding transcriptional regulator ModE
MAKSKVRGGKKAHKAKVEMRNQKLKSTQSAMEKLFKESMNKEIEAMKAKIEKETVHDTAHDGNSTENTEQ